MHECIKKLLRSKDEESLESLSRLLTTVGKDLEAETNEKMKIAKSQEEVKNNVSLNYLLIVIEVSNSSCITVLSNSQIDLSFTSIIYDFVIYHIWICHLP